MKDRDVDTHLKHLLGDPARDLFKQQVLQDSTAEFLRIRWQHSVWRKAGLAVVAMLIMSITFFAGRLSAPASLPDSGNTSLADSGSGSVDVPEELVAWLDAARLFGQLGMESRMAHAVARAARLLPDDAVIAGDRAEHVFATAESKEQQNNPIEPSDGLGPHLSAETVNQILALTFGD